MAKVPVIDADLCTGCELCVDTCGDVFEMKDDLAVVYNAEGADEDEIQDAIDNCPVEAIGWKE